jgi:hypothetical protein
MIYLAIATGLFLGTRCQPAVSNTPSVMATTSSQTTEAVAPTPGDLQMTFTPSTPVTPNLEKLIETAKADLASRLSLSAEEILVLEATSVTWPDASLGCPREGMLYAQILSPGYLIRLQSGDREFDYHAGRGGKVFYCENPKPPVPGMPGDI